MNAKTRVLFCWRQDWKQFDQMFEQISGRHCSACATWRRAWTQLSDHLNLLLSFFYFLFAELAITFCVIFIFHYQCLGPKDLIHKEQIF